MNDNQDKKNSILVDLGFSVLTFPLRLMIGPKIMIILAKFKLLDRAFGQFVEYIDFFPMHFVVHIREAIQVIAFAHPDKEIRECFMFGERLLARQMASAPVTIGLLNKKFKTIKKKKRIDNVRMVERVEAKEAVEPTPVKELTLRINNQIVVYDNPLINIKNEGE
jgi:hypothetical protein